MTLTGLLEQLSTRGLALRRDGDSIEVAGDAAQLTEEIKESLAEHKASLLQLIPEPRERPAWWVDHLTDAQNEAVDEFMARPAIEDSIAIIDVTPCGRCDSLLAWWDAWGSQHCLRCDPPLKATAAAKHAERIRQCASYAKTS